MLCYAMLYYAILKQCCGSSIGLQLHILMIMTFSLLGGTAHCITNCKTLMQPTLMLLKSQGQPGMYCLCVMMQFACCAFVPLCLTESQAIAAKIRAALYKSCLLALTGLSIMKCNRAQHHEVK